MTPEQKKALLVPVILVLLAFLLCKLGPEILFGWWQRMIEGPRAP